MSDDALRTYEGLFLLPHTATANMQEASDHVKELLRRAGAEILSFRRWDERRLAYEIQGNKRGLYFLVYFRAQPSRVPGLERDCNLSEQLLRSLVTRADHVTEEHIKAADGQQELADEIRLRASAPPAAKRQGGDSAAATSAVADDAGGEGGFDED
jgi:small subunit ribosomal protein S6